jgi:hypothetical protein
VGRILQANHSAGIGCRQVQNFLPRCDEQKMPLLLDETLFDQLATLLGEDHFSGERFRVHLTIADSQKIPPRACQSWSQDGRKASA